MHAFLSTLASAPKGRFLPGGPLLARWQYLHLDAAFWQGPNRARQGQRYSARVAAGLASMM
eukprot:1214236-Pleurochrysis_carterae.AAC.1